jgi:hypothetical protein
MIFCAIGDRLGPLVIKAFDEDNRITLDERAWLVSADVSTSKLVWERLVSHHSGAEGTPPPSGIVFPVRGYHGRRPPAVWEWIAAKRSSNDLI